MKKLVLAAAACILGFSLFLGVQTASADVFDVTGPYGTNGTYDGAWEIDTDSPYQFSLQISQTGGLALENQQVFGLSYGGQLFPLLNSSLSFYDFTSEANKIESWKFYFLDPSESPEVAHTDYDLLYVGNSHYELEFLFDGSDKPARITVKGVVPTPVPTAALLLGSGIVGLVSFRRRFGK
jgi:hypothetical protein